MSAGSALDIFNLPEDPFEKRAAILSQALQETIPRTAAFIAEEYPRIELLRKCIRFCNWELLDAPRADGESLRRVWFFPWSEATRELDQVQSACMLALYKAAHDHLRRALELVLAGIYFTLENTPEEDARAWLASADGTPRFSQTTRRIRQHSAFSTLEDICGWSGKLQRLYHTLCDVVHVRGQEWSFHAVQPSSLHLGDVWVPEFNAAALTRVLDLFIEVARNIATAMAASNPVLLVGLDMDAKFGLNDPVGGFFSEGQSELLRSLILDEAKPVLEATCAENPEVLGLMEWYAALPDITEEELALQADQIRKELGNDG